MYLLCPDAYERMVRIMNYRIFSVSLPGEKYSKKGFPCQDSSGCIEKNGIKIVVVADGHGSNDCFRSEVGSRLAVECLINSALPLLKYKDGTFSETGIKNFKYSFWMSWRNAVKQDWETRAPNDQEVRFKYISEKYKERYFSSDSTIQERYLYNAYGTTMLCAIAIENQILLLQIGDGTCIVLQKNGLFTTPVPKDDDNFLNVTTSLCEQDADTKIRHAVLDCSLRYPNCPVAIFLSSDGLDDCFANWKNEEHLFKFYKVIIDAIANDGFVSVNQEIIEDVLPKMSSNGSRDDISLGYLIMNKLVLLKHTLKKIKLPQSGDEENDEN